MADQNPNPNQNNAQASIDSLVNELSKPATPPPPSSAPVINNPTPPKPVMPAPMAPTPKPAPAPAPMMPPKPVMPSASPSMPVMPKPQMPSSAPAPAPAPKSSFSMPPKPTQTPASSAIPDTTTAQSAGPKTTLPPEQLQPYQTNIRTMADDLASLKSGKQPEGMNIPRTPGPAPMPNLQPAPGPQQPTNMPPRPVMPNISIPRAVQTPGIPSNKPNPSPMPNISRPEMPAINQTPIMPKADKAPNQSSIFAPDNQPKVTPSGRGGNRNLLFIGVGVVIVLLASAYWFFFIRQPSDQVTVVPTQSSTPTPTATPQIKISSIFNGSAGTIALASNNDPFQTLATGLKVISISPGRLGVLNVTDSASGNALMPFDLFDRLSVAYPTDLKPLAGANDGVILIYGQQEAYNAKGQVIAPTSMPNRIVLVSQVSNNAVPSMLSWESTITDNLEKLFGYNKAKNTGPFSDNYYQGIPVRFKNFPNPDMTIDYAIVPFNGSTYLVITNSREAMFAAIGAFVPTGK